jgi:hypothetical protein
LFSLADASPRDKNPVYGESSPIKLTSDLEGMKIVLELPGRPWEKKHTKYTEIPD